MSFQDYLKYCRISVDAYLNSTFFNKHEGLPGVLGEQGNIGKISKGTREHYHFLGTGEQNSKHYSTKTFGKCVGTWEHRAILEGNKGTRTPPGRLSGDNATTRQRKQSMTTFNRAKVRAVNVISTTLSRNTTQTAVINIFKIRILLNLTFRMFVHIHFQKYNRYGFWKLFTCYNNRGLEPRQR